MVFDFDVPLPQRQEVVRTGEVLDLLFPLPVAMSTCKNRKKSHELIIKQALALSLSAPSSTCDHLCPG